jgi:metal-responsive CopG/Arc/MetJ family transcriptional regulator
MKARITVSLPPHLARRLAQELRERRGQGRRMTRSGLIQELLERHYMQAHWRAQEAATVAYYSGLSPEARAEDRAVARAGADALARVLERGERGAPRRTRRRP